MQPSVSLIRAPSYERQLLRDALERLLHPLGGMATFVKPGNRVLLKPNLLTGANPGKECTTQSRVGVLRSSDGTSRRGQTFFGR